jgi:hypothetical protein
MEVVFPQPGFGIPVYNCIGRQHHGQVVQVGDEYGLEYGEFQSDGFRKVSRRVTQMDAQIPQSILLSWMSMACRMTSFIGRISLMFLAELRRWLRRYRRWMRRFSRRFWT